MTAVELYILIPLLVILLLTQSTLLFIDAKKKKSFAWFWGLWGLIQFPMPTLFYFLFVILPHRKNEMKRGDKNGNIK